MCLPATSSLRIRCWGTKPSNTGTTCVTPSPVSTTTPVIRPCIASTSSGRARWNSEALCVAEYDMLYHAVICHVMAWYDMQYRLAEVKNNRCPTVMPWGIIIRSTHTHSRSFHIQYDLPVRTGSALLELTHCMPQTRMFQTSFQLVSHGFSLDSWGAPWEGFYVLMGQSVSTWVREKAYRGDVIEGRGGKELNNLFSWSKGNSNGPLSTISSDQ